MSSADPVRRLRTAKRVERLALWTAVGVVLAGLERLVPPPLPWIRLGLANGAALVVLVVHGWRAALGVNLLRAVVVGFLFGTWASPAVALSLAGAAVAVPAMEAVRRIGGGHVGPVGMSAAGAFVHMLVQFALAALLFVRSASLLAFAGPSLVAAVVSGVLVGLLAALVLKRMPWVLLRGEREGT